MECAYMNTVRVKMISTITLIVTLGICLFSAFTAFSELLLHEVPLQYEMLGSFYSCILMKDIGEWIPQASEPFEYIWIVLSFAYVFGKIIFVAAASCVNYKKRMIGLMIPICIFFLLDVPAWLHTAYYWQDIAGWAIAGAVLRILLIGGHFFTAFYEKKRKPNLQCRCKVNSNLSQIIRYL